MTEEPNNRRQVNCYDIALATVIIIIAIIQVYLFSQLQHIASPIFGGDLYRERGFIQHIINGDNYWKDPYFKDELEFYPPLGYLLGAFIATITGASIDTVINFFPVFITAFITLAFYKLGKEIFKTKQHAFLLALIGLTYNLFPVKHTYGMAVGFAILFLTYFFKLESTQTLKTKILAGIFFGLSALSHYQPFLYTGVITGTIVIFELISTRSIPILIKKYAITFGVAFILAMIFFAPLIIKYQMKTPNRTQEYSQFDTNKNGAGWLAKTIIQQFIQTTTIPNFLLGLLGLAGVVACALNKSRTENRYSLWLFAGIIISGGHYLITKPLLNAWVVPSHMMAGIFIPFSILTVWGIKFFQTITTKKIIMPVIILVIILPLLIYSITNYDNDKWVNYGRQMDPATKTLYEMSEWILAATTNNDVFLANDESAFALNALTGRKVVAVRRTHASPYADVDKRYADTIVMFYGNNTNTTKELIKKYSVSYAYIDQYLLSQPMITSTKYAKYLEENGVKFTIQNVRLDPADINTPTYESIIVMPQELKITNITTSAKQFNAGGQPYAVLYVVSRES